MKLLLCMNCGDIFNLAKGRIKACHCGRVCGKYEDDGLNAVVNGKGYSLAMGNGSVIDAIKNLDKVTEDFRITSDNFWEPHYTSIICWARPHEGDTNPHTRVDPSLQGPNPCR